MPEKPQTVEAADLDLSGLRAHCREHHKLRFGESWPRSNRDLATWHARRHHRYSSAMPHIHRGIPTLIRRGGHTSPAGMARPLGWYTGQDMVTRTQLRVEMQARQAERQEHRA